MNVLSPCFRAASDALADEIKLPPDFHLPRVSVIIVNYNYGRYLAAAVASIFGQTYPNVECIIVDNASTDETPSVLLEITARHPSVITLRRDKNEGQTAASLDGLRRASGSYIVFVDADDVLLPACIETHIYVHLSSRIHVGFTAVDMLQATHCGDIVVGTGEAMNRCLRRRRGKAENILRPRRFADVSAILPLAETINSKIRYVPPSSMNWVWSPTSGLCFRRDALALFSDNENLQDLRTGTDLYFAHGIGAWCGSILIDEPLFIYRIHRSNIFSRNIQLNNVLNYDLRGPGNCNDKARLVLADQFIRRCARFSQGQIHFKLRFAALLFRLDGKDGNPSLPRWARRSRVAQRLIAHFDDVAQEFGKAPACLFLLFFGVPFALIWQCCRRRSAVQIQD